MPTLQNLWAPLRFSIPNLGLFSCNAYPYGGVDVSGGQFGRLRRPIAGGLRCPRRAHFSAKGVLLALRKQGAHCSLLKQEPWVAKVEVLGPSGGHLLALPNLLFQLWPLGAKTGPEPKKRGVFSSLLYDPGQVDPPKRDPGPFREGSKR